MLVFLFNFSFLSSLCVSLAGWELLSLQLSTDRPTREAQRCSVGAENIQNSEDLYHTRNPHAL